jgi:phosphatidylglycerol:prolipoprotein diacylglycerol transferase
MLQTGFSLPLAIFAQVRWDVDPVIFHLGPLPIRWYSLGWLLAFGVGFYIVQWMFRKEGKPEEDLEPILFYMLAGAMIGARLGHVLFYRPDYYLSHPIEIIAFWKGVRGLASHGGALGILLSLYLYARRHPEHSYLWLLDRVAVPTALGGMFIRLGNLMNSEILGLPSDLPWAMVFVRVDNVPRHPAQLYEALAYLLIFLVLITLYRRQGARVPRGRLIGTFFALVFTARFIIEFVKERHVPFEASLPLSMGQILSIPMVALGLGLLWWSGRRPVPSPAPQPAPSTETGPAARKEKPRKKRGGK